MEDQPLQVISCFFSNIGKSTLTGDVIGSVFKFLVDGEKKSTFICTPLTLAVDEETVCDYYVTGKGEYEVEIRGATIGNIEKATIECK